MTESEHIVVLVTAESEVQARKLAQVLLEKKLAACANLVPVTSVFVWDGAVQEEAEVLMIIKSASAVFKEKLVSTIKAHHNYDVPEIIGMPIVLGSSDYGFSKF